MFNFSTWVKLLIICNITAVINKKIRVEFAMKTGRDFKTQNISSEKLWIHRTVIIAADKRKHSKRGLKLLTTKNIKPNLKSNVSNVFYSQSRGNKGTLISSNQRSWIWFMFSVIRKSPVISFKMTWNCFHLVDNLYNWLLAYTVRYHRDFRKNKFSLKLTDFPFSCFVIFLM